MPARHRDILHGSLALITLLILVVAVPSIGVTRADPPAPDRSLLFLTPAREVWEFDLGSLTARPLIVGRGVYEFGLSPDGRRLAFVAEEPGTEFGSLWVAGPDGAEPTMISPGPIPPFAWSAASSLAWAPDSRHLAFGEAGPDAPLKLHDLSSNRTWDLTTRARHPAWSPEGSRIAFARLAGKWSSQGETLEGGVWAIDRDGTRLRQVARGCDCLFRSAAPRWSADGQWLSYRLLYEESVTLVVPAAGGSHLLQEHAVQWAPSGAKLAVGARYNHPALSILASPLGPELLTCCGEVPGRALSLAFAPDGQTLAAAVDNRESFDSAAAQTAIWLVPQEGPARVVYQRDQLTAHDLAWAPDSSTLLFVVREQHSGSAKPPRLVIIGTDGQQLAEIEGEAPAWRPKKFK